ncbi:MAG: hypothetical protein E7561_01850 [Ruminococcaceae bacterium]|nr:hypothetical protein [Oscillospiraceae bacterium]
MRKIIICIMLCTVLCGCGGKADAKPILNDISFDINITYYNEGYFAKGKIQDNTLTLEMKEPSEIEGMVLILGESSVKINYKGLTYEPTENSLLPSAAGMLYDALSAVLKGDIELQNDEKNLSVTKKLQNGEFVMRFSPSGLPIDINYMSGVFSGEFSNVTMF